jgi:hypothetical protein
MSASLKSDRADGAREDVGVEVVHEILAPWGDQIETPFEHL